MTHEAVLSRWTWELVKVENVVPISATELVAPEVTTAGTTGWEGPAGMVELVSTSGLVAIDGALSDSLWETGGAVLENVGRVLAVWETEGTLVSDSPVETLRDGRAEVASVSERELCVALVSGSCRESVRVAKVVLVSAPELVTNEVTTPDTPG